MNKLNQRIKLSQKNTVNWHNDCPDTYFFGNSIVGASAHPDARMTFVIGPDYTCPNYIREEELFLLMDGQKFALDFQMKRLRHSGVFFDSCCTNGVSVFLWDFAPTDRPYILRFVHIASNDRDISGAKICAAISPFESTVTAVGARLTIHKDTSRFCFGNRETLNWADRYCDVFFGGALAECTAGADESYVLQTGFDTNGCAALYHCCYYDAPPALEESPLELLELTLHDWENWLAAGKTPPVENTRDADALESLLLSAKMQQNRDGGSIAGIRKYANSYIRDTHGSMRLFLAAGHHEEVARLLLNIHSRWSICGFIPNWWSMGSDTFIGHSFHNDASEVTAYYIFMARDYYAHTQDMALLRRIAPSLAWAATAQLEWLESHDYTMDFNGDETEQYCCNHDGEEYGGFVNPEYPWNAAALSFPSMSAALCSLAWYFEFFGGMTDEIKNKLTRLKDKIDEVFYSETDGLHSWSAMPSDNGYLHHKAHLTNYLLLPLWFGTKLNKNAERTNAAAVRSFLKSDGFLPNSPQAMQGFCGHTMGLFLYDMTLLAQDAPETFADAATNTLRTILDSRLLSMYGTVWEFYGPSCTPNGHNCRPLEGGIVGEALIRCWNSKITESQEARQ